MRCLHPLTVNPYKNIKRYIDVPCGKCPNCVKTKRDNLAFRLDAEYNSKDTLFALFVTLTYDDVHLPTTVNDLTGEVFHYLSGDDVHKFFKYLRKLGKPFDLSFKYFLCGEYGDKFGRPHYHAIFFIKHVNSRYPVEFIRSIIDKSWVNGFVDVQLPHNGFRAFNYVTKYVIKNSAFVLNEHYKDRKPFIRMSNGIGLLPIMRYKFDPYSQLKVSDSQNRIHLLPRYYLTHVFNDLQIVQHQLYSKSFITDQFIDRCKRYGFASYQLEEFDWSKRVADSLTNLRKTASFSSDIYYKRSFDYL